jgi:hypothetical protein
VKHWRMIPMALRVALVTFAVNALVMLIATSQHLHFATSMKLVLLTSGTSFMAEAFALYGTLELTKLLTGRAALGAKIAAFGWFVSIVVTFVMIASRFSSDIESMRSFSSYISWGWFFAKTCIAVGLVVAAWKRPPLAVACLVVCVIVNRPPALEHWFTGLVGESIKYVHYGLQPLYAAALLALVIIAVAGLPDDFVMREPQRAERGLDWMASSLWLRVCALVVVPLLTLMMVAGDGRGAEKILGYGALIAAGVNIMSFAWFGLGSLEVARSRHLEVRSGPFLVAAAGSLWCAGVSLHQLPDLYSALTGHSRYSFSSADNFAAMFPYVMPLVGTATIIAAALAIAGFAKRRENLELAGRGERSAILVGVLQLLTLGTITYLLPEARSTSSFMLLTLMALTFGLIAIVSAARLARDAAVVVEAAPPTIPSAQLL